MWLSVLMLNFSYSKQTDQAVQAIMKIDKFRRIFLLLLIKMLIFNEHSLTEWKTIIMRQGVSGQFIDSMVFFTYVDCGLLDRAKTVLQVSQAILLVHIYKSNFLLLCSCRT